MAKSKVKISKIDIEIGDVEVSITPDQAKQLLEALSELVGEKQVVERVIERDRYPSWPRPYVPYEWRTYTDSTDKTLSTPYIGWSSTDTVQSGINVVGDTAKISV